MRRAVAFGFVAALLWCAACAHAPEPLHDSAIFKRCMEQCRTEEDAPIDPFVIETQRHAYCFCHTPDAPLPEKT